MYRYMYVQWFFSPPLLQNLIPYTIYKVLSSISCENSVFTKKKVYMQYLVTLTAISPLVTTGRVRRWKSGGWVEFEENERG